MGNSKHFFHTHGKSLAPFLGPLRTKGKSESLTVLEISAFKRVAAGAKSPDLQPTSRQESRSFVTFVLDGLESSYFWRFDRDKLLYHLKTNSIVYDR